MTNFDSGKEVNTHDLGQENEWYFTDLPKAAKIKPTH
jgi:hypothetical protein